MIQVAKAPALNKLLSQPSLKRGQSAGSEVCSQSSYSPPKRGRQLDALEDETQRRVFTVDDEPGGGGARRNWDQSTITAPDTRSTLVAQGFARPAPTAAATPKNGGSGGPLQARGPGAGAPTTSSSGAGAGTNRAKPAEQALRNAVLDQLDDERATRTGRLGVKTSDDEDDEEAFPSRSRRNEYRNQPVPAAVRAQLRGDASGGGSRDNASQVSNSSTASARNQLNTMALKSEPQLPPCKWAHQLQQDDPNQTPWQSTLPQKLFQTSSRPPPATPQPSLQESNDPSQ